MKRLRWHLLFAALAGLALRLFFILRFPADSGDTPAYEALAANWLSHGTYGLLVDGRLTAVDVRVPGYPAFLAAIYALTGHTGAAARFWVMFAQAVADVATCFLAAALAAALAVLAGARSRARAVFCAALWLAVTCPFTANYTAVPLTEVFATFFTTAALIPLALLAANTRGSGVLFVDRAWAFANNNWLLGFCGAILVGCGTLFRPESPLLLIVSWMVLGAALLLQHDGSRWIRMVLWMGLSFAIPLVPWIARNALTLYEFQPLSPRYAELPGELVPRGFIAWEKTWLVRMRDVYAVSWKVEEEPIAVEDIPASAFDSPEERARVTALLSQYNSGLTLTQELDDGFAQLARERTARHPWRTYLRVPFARTFTIWFTPRTELLPISGRVWPLGKRWHDDPLDFSGTAGYFLLNLIYVGLAIAGAWRLSRAAPAGNSGATAALALIGVYLLVRTAFFTTVETPEPRYVLECIPAVLALAAQTWTRQRSSTGSG